MALSVPQRKNDQYSRNTSGQVRKSKSNGSCEPMERRPVRPDTEITKTMRAHGSGAGTAAEPPQMGPEDLGFLMERA